MTFAQMGRVRRGSRPWLSTVPPCGISHVEIFNPCLPEDVGDGPLLCLTCGLRQRLELAGSPGTPEREMFL